MNIRTTALAAAAAACLALFGPAQADVLSADFNINIDTGSPVTTVFSGGSVSYSLNPDGTIAASLSLTLPTYNFAANSSLYGVPAVDGSDLTNFTAAIGAFSGVTGFNDWNGGQYNMGFSCDPACQGSVSWTISTPGGFASVWDALAGDHTSNPYDFILQTDNPDDPLNNAQWAATAVAVTATLPEPATALILLQGLGLLGWAGRRRKQRPAA